MRRFLNNRISNCNNVGDKVDDFCEDCENRWLPFSRVWWDSTEKNIADIKRKDNGIFVIKKILSLINSISESIKDIYDRINVIEPPILSEKLLELENDYLEVGVTADDKQEDLNIAIYENYINLKNTKVDKPLIESTSNSLKIVALNEQGESVFIKSNELGKVKSVNNKIGDVILKTSDLENDSDYTTNLKLNQERDERISGDNLKLDKPTTSGTITTHPNIVGVDDLGNSAKLKATDFGKVKSVNGKDGDVILKTSDLENDSDYTTNATLTAHTSNKSNPHNVTKEQLGLGNVDNTSDLNKPISTATQTELNKKINKPTTNNTPDYVLLADGSTAPKSDFGKVDKVMGVFPDANKNVDISGVAMNWTHASQRMSALVSKHNDATYNRLLGMDANGNLNEVGLNAVTNAMSKSSDAQKDAWRVANRKSDETYSIGVPRVDYCYPYIVDSRKDYLQYIFFYGINLFLDLKNSSLKLVNITTSQAITVDNFEVVTGLTTFLKIGLNFNLIPNGEYHLVITNPLGFTNIDTYKFTVSNNVQQVDLSAFEIANENFKIGTDFQSSISPKNITFQNLVASSSSAQAMARRLVTKSQSLPVTGNFILDFNFNVIKPRDLADNNTGTQHSFGIVSSSSTLTESGITPSIGYQFKAASIGLFSSSRAIGYNGFPSGLYRARIVRQNGQFEVSIVLPNNTVLSDIIPDTLGSTIYIVSNFTGFYVSNSAQIVFELLSITN